MTAKLVPALPRLQRLTTSGLSTAPSIVGTGPPGGGATEVVGAGGRSGLTRARRRKLRRARGDGANDGPYELRQHLLRCAATICPDPGQLARLEGALLRLLAAPDTEHAEAHQSTSIRRARGGSFAPRAPTSHETRRRSLPLA